MRPGAHPSVPSILGHFLRASFHGGELYDGIYPESPEKPISLLMNNSPTVGNQENPALGSSSATCCVTSGQFLLVSGSC